MNFNKFIRRASTFSVAIYAMNDEETEFRFSTKWEIPCKMKKENDIWIGTLFSKSLFISDMIIKGTKREVSEKCLEHCVLGGKNE
jgi:hypothetical protein